MYSGYQIRLGSQTKFVTPAILGKAIAVMVQQIMDEDPQNEFQITIKWVENGIERPQYTA